MNRTSLTSKVTSLIVWIILLSCALAMFAIISLTYSLHDAKAINASGSLRMQSYRILFYLNNDPDLINSKITEFESTLYSNELRLSLSWPTPTNVTKRYLKVIEDWHAIKPFIVNHNLPEYKKSVQNFVKVIDLYVGEMEKFSASKLMLLAIIQVIGLVIMLFIAYFSRKFLKNQLVKPLDQLVLAADTIAKGDFNICLPQSDYAELYTLSNTLKSTTKKLSELYFDLESKVISKTEALSIANNELNCLYQTLLLLHTENLNSCILEEILNNIKNYESIEYIRLIIDNKNPTIITASNGWDFDLAVDKYTLQFDQKILGSLEIIAKDNNILNNNLLANLAKILTKSLVLNAASEQKQQVALLEERGAIARELHDSLGQLLAFLKIQINLLSKGLCHNNSQKIKIPLQEINQGISLAYSQLRELLSTFRLNISEPDLENSIKSVLKNLQNLTDAKLSLNYEFPHLLSAPLHIHILQIIREAIINAIKHSQATTIEVHCFILDKVAVINISDDGIGPSQLFEKEDHFGIKIMQERAKRLNGELNFIALEKGTQINLQFNLEGNKYV